MDKNRQRLENLKADLEVLSANSREDRAIVMLDQQSVGRLSRMDAMQRQAMAEESERKRKLDLTRIDMALRRLNDGVYGLCEDCGEPIPAKRMEIDPMAERCVQCAAG